MDVLRYFNGKRNPNFYEYHRVHSIFILSHSILRVHIFQGTNLSMFYVLSSRLFVDNCKGFPFSDSSSKAASFHASCYRVVVDVHSTRNGSERIESSYRSSWQYVGC